MFPIIILTILIGYVSTTVCQILFVSIIAPVMLRFFDKPKPTLFKRDKTGDPNLHYSKEIKQVTQTYIIQEIKQVTQTYTIQKR